MYSALGGLFNIPDGSHEDYYFAGYSGGFKTQYQDYVSGTANWSEGWNNYDSYVYRMDFSNANDSGNCLYQSSLFNSVSVNVAYDTSGDSEVFTFIDAPGQLGSLHVNPVELLHSG